MQVISKNPILIEGDYSEQDWFSNASGATRRARRASRKKKRGEKGSFAQRVATGLEKTQRALGTAIDVLGTGSAMNTGYDPNAFTPEPFVDPTPPKKGLSTGANIAIAVGVFALIGAAVYFSTKKK